MLECKKWFEEPELEITKLVIADVITTSDEEWRDDEDWQLPEF